MPLSPIAFRGGIHTRIYGCIGNDAATPDRFHQVVPTHNPFSVTNEALEKIENLRLNSYQSVASKQFAAIYIENIVVKLKQHQLLQYSEKIKAL